MVEHVVTVFSWGPNHKQHKRYILLHMNGNNFVGSLSADKARVLLQLGCPLRV